MRQYLSLIKFSHTIFAMPFALIGFFLAVWYARYSFELKVLGLVILCMVFARNAAMAFNRLADMKIDKLNPRTEKRELPTRKMNPASVLIFVLINCALFIVSAWLINDLCFYLSPVALVVVLGYSYTKRFTALSHLILGIGLSLAPIGAYIAVTEHFDLLPILFSIVVLFWVGGFDIIYAMQDKEFDEKYSLKSIPTWAGKKNALIISSLFHAIAAGSIIFAGIYAKLGLYYWIGTGLFIALIIYQHTLVKPDDLKKVNLAFFITNGIASVIFAIFVILELWLASNG